MKVEIVMDRIVPNYARNMLHDAGRSSLKDIIWKYNALYGAGWKRSIIVTR